MAGNSFGQLFRISTFGESHGEALGVVIDGCPAGLDIDTAFISRELARRKPGQSSITTSRNEAEAFELLSGVFEGKSTGAPIAMLVRNTDQRSQDYDHLRNVYRPSHADYTYDARFGRRDHRGGGRSSARETLARVMGGAIAKMLLRENGIDIKAFVSQVHHIKLSTPYTQLNLEQAEQNAVRCPDQETAAQMISFIEQVKAEGDSVGGIVSCVVSGMLPGLGEPVFDKLHADLGKAMLSINACKGFDTGSGFDSVLMKGSEHNDAFVSDDKNHVRTASNHSGGVQGGISNGQDLYFRCAFKPVSTIHKAQQTLDNTGQQVTLEATGRHDPCVVPRAVPIVEAMAALVLADHLLRLRSARL